MNRKESDMAITWDYSKKCGEATFQTRYEGVEPGSYTVNLYEGNCFLIMINEYTDEDGTEMAALNSFFCDEEHISNRGKCSMNSTRIHSALQSVRL